MSDEEDVEVLDQGEDYDESYTEDADEADEDTEVSFDTIYGIPKKYVYIGAAVILVLIVAIVIIKTRSNKEIETTMTQDGVPEGAVSLMPPADDIPFDESDVEFDDEEVVVVTDDSSASEDTEDGEATPITISDLTDEQNEELRKLGYTGDEIELILQSGVSLDDMIEHAKELHDDASIESYKRMADHASKEFKYIVTNTYFSQDLHKYTGDEEPYEMYKETVIADYVKCPSYGVQPLLKCKITNHDYAFVNVDPYVYYMLPPNGNVNIEVTYRTAYGNDWVIGAEVLVDDSLIIQTTDKETGKTILDDTEKREDIIKEEKDAEHDRLVEEAKEQLRKELEEEVRREQEQQAAEQEEGENAEGTAEDN